jgi:SAM-dependent methyltransferase
MIANVHVDDMLACRHEHLPLGSGNVDLSAAVAALAAAGYRVTGADASAAMLEQAIDMGCDEEEVRGTYYYARALEEPDNAALRLALARNVLRDETRTDAPEAHRLAAYACAIEVQLATYDLNHFLSGTIGFPAPQTGAA